MTAGSAMLAYELGVKQKCGGGAVYGVQRSHVCRQPSETRENADSDHLISQAATLQISVLYRTPPPVRCHPDPKVRSINNHFQENVDQGPTRLMAHRLNPSVFLIYVSDFDQLVHVREQWIVSERDECQSLPPSPKTCSLTATIISSLETTPGSHLDLPSSWIDRSGCTLCGGQSCSE
ncbi:hypothetical protein BC827DRAFT_707919 [Russula dissimulans]|nr:hypothetical protein BC827DRAFT_707919 [Russula dissimulans]